MVSQGAACHSGKKYRSHVLKAMNVDHVVASTAIRISLGLTTTFEEVDAFAKLWILYYNKQQKNQR
jgi:cysteine desulfurase